MSAGGDLMAAIRNTRAAMRKKARLAGAYQRLWDDPDGKLVFNDLLGRAGLLTTHEAPCDPDTRSFEAGQRSMGVHIVQRLRWSEAELVAMARRQTEESIEMMEDA